MSRGPCLTQIDFWKSITASHILAGARHVARRVTEGRQPEGDRGTKCRVKERTRVACVAWRFWLGALSNKGGRGQRNREEIGAEATLFFSRLRRSFSGASRANFAATPLLRPAQQNRHATQARTREETYTTWLRSMWTAALGDGSRNETGNAKVTDRC